MSPVLRRQELTWSCMKAASSWRAQEASSPAQALGWHCRQIGQMDHEATSWGGREEPCSYSCEVWCLLKVHKAGRLRVCEWKSVGRRKLHRGPFPTADLHTPLDFSLQAPVWTAGPPSFLVPFSAPQLTAVSLKEGVREPRYRHDTGKQILCVWKTLVPVVFHWEMEIDFVKIT